MPNLLLYDGSPSPVVPYCPKVDPRPVPRPEPTRLDPVRPLRPVVDRPEDRPGPPRPVVPSPEPVRPDGPLMPTPPYRWC